MGLKILQHHVGLYLMIDECLCFTTSDLQIEQVCAFREIPIHPKYHSDQGQYAGPWIEIVFVILRLFSSSHLNVKGGRFNPMVTITLIEMILEIFALMERDHLMQHSGYIMVMDSLPIPW